MFSKLYSTLRLISLAELFIFDALTHTFILLLLIFKITKLVQKVWIYESIRDLFTVYYC